MSVRHVIENSDLQVIDQKKIRLFGSYVSTYLHEIFIYVLLNLQKLEILYFKMNNAP